MASERPAFVDELIAEGVPEAIADPELRCEFFAWLCREMEEHPEEFESLDMGEPLEIRVGVRREGEGSIDLDWVRVYQKEEDPDA